MSDPLQEKPCKSDGAKSHPSKKQQTVVQSLKSTATTYISRFITYVNGLFSNKQVLGGNLQTRIYDDLKELVCKTENKINEVYGKIVTEVKLLEQNELQACKNYSKEELAKVDRKFKVYYITIQKIFEELMERLHGFKKRLQTKIVTYEEYQSLITYLEEKINQTRKLTQGMNKNIQQTITNPKLEEKLIDTVESHYKKVISVMDTLCTAVKETDVHEKWKLKFRISQIKNLVIVSEIKIKELFHGILKKAKNVHDNELQTYKNYSKEELFKVKSNLQEYSVKIRKLSDDTLKYLHVLKIDFQRQVMTHRDFQNLVSYIDGKVIEIKKLTEELLKNIQTTIKEPILGKKLMAVVESNTQKIKITVDDLYTAIKGNFTKTNGFKSMTDKTMLFSKLPVLGKFKQSVNCSPLSLPNNGTKMVSECKGNSVVGLHKKRISFFNLCKHFNSTTNHARTNVAKATYAGILIYYLYKKIKNTT